MSGGHRWPAASPTTPVDGVQHDVDARRIVTAVDQGVLDELGDRYQRVGVVRGPAEAAAHPFAVVDVEVQDALAPVSLAMATRRRRRGTLVGVNDGDVPTADRTARPTAADEQPRAAPSPARSLTRSGPRSMLAIRSGPKSTRRTATSLMLRTSSFIGAGAPLDVVATATVMSKRRRSSRWMRRACRAGPTPRSVLRGVDEQHAD